jgi:lipopolysaccharide export system protein LptA
MMLPTLALSAALLAPPAAPAAPPRPTVRIQAEDVDYSVREGRTVMTGNPDVTLTRDDAVLTCHRLVLESDAKGKVQRATCEGNVRLTRSSRVITCTTAVYEDEAARVVCKGNPTLRDGSSELTGEELVYDLDEDRVRLTKGKGTLYQPPGQALGPRQRGGKP